MFSCLTPLGQEILVISPPFEECCFSNCIFGSKQVLSALGLKHLCNLSWSSVALFFTLRGGFVKLPVPCLPQLLEKKDTATIHCIPSGAFPGHTTSSGSSEPGSHELPSSLFTLDNCILHPHRFFFKYLW